MYNSLPLSPSSLEDHEILISQLSVQHAWSYTHWVKQKQKPETDIAFIRTKLHFHKSRLALNTTFGVVDGVGVLTNVVPVLCSHESKYLLYVSLFAFAINQAAFQNQLHPWYVQLEVYHPQTIGLYSLEIIRFVVQSYGWYHVGQEVGLLFSKYVMMENVTP